MSITLITGRSGSGKTTTILNEIIDQLKMDKTDDPIILIAPEQMTFLAEYKLVSNKDVRGMIRCQVYSFTRLAWKLLQDTGYMNKQFLDQMGVSMLIQKIIEENANELHLFSKAAQKQGFISQVEQMITEFKRYCIEPHHLLIEVDDVILKEKLHDLQFIFQKFQHEIENSYLLQEDYLSLLTRHIKTSDYIKNASIYIDGFYDLTTLEYTVMEQLLIHAKNVTVSFTLDPSNEQIIPDDMQLFRKSNEYFHIVSQQCKNNQLTYKTKHLIEQKRFLDKGIAHIEANFAVYPIVQLADSCHVRFVQAANKRAEIEEVAREILRLVQDEGYRYKDITVLYRDQKEYGPYIEMILKDYDIKVHVDMKKTMQNHPLIEMIRSLLAIVQTNFQYEAVFRYLKTGLVYPYFMKENELTYNELKYFQLVDQMENYCLEYGIRGSKYNKKWTYKKERTNENASEEVKKRNEAFDEKLDDFKKRLVEPIYQFQQIFKKEPTGLEAIKALYQLIEKLKVDETLSRWRYFAEATGELETASTHEQAWNKLIELFDQYVELLQDEKVDLDTFVSIIEAGLESMEFSLVPQAIDQVLVANYEQSRVYDVKVAFVVGLTDNSLPLKRSPQDIFNDKQRELLNEKNIKLAPSNRIRLLDEEFVAYRTFTIPSERLYVSYPIADEEGKAIMPSIYMKRLKGLLPHVETKLVIVDPLDLPIEEQREFINHKDVTLSYLIAQLKKQQLVPIDPLWLDVKQYYQTNPLYQSKLEKLLQSINYENKTERLKQDLAHELFTKTKEIASTESTETKKELVASVSRMEKFNSCHFAHFAHYGLNLRERKIYRLQNFDIGELFHEVLQLLSEQVSQKKIMWEDLTKEKSNELAEQFINEVSKDKKKMIFTEEKHSYLRYKLKETLAATIYRIAEHGTKSEFIPVKLELEFGKDANATKIPIGNEASMRITGKIDRVDELTLKDKTYVRIIDYKSSSHDIDLTDVYNGLQLQMITYLDHYLTTEEEKKYPAGMLYFHVHHPFISTKKGLEQEKVETELQKAYKMQGIVLKDTEVLKAMDKDIEKESKIIPASLKKDGDFTKNSKVMEESDFHTLRKFVNSKYKQAGDAILAGEITINPYKMNQQTPCTYCNFKSVCQFDETLKGNSYRQLPKLSKDLVLEKMEAHK